MTISLPWVWSTRQTTGKFGFYWESWVRQNATGIRIIFYQNIPRDYNFAEMVEIFKQIFGECISLFNIRFNCLNITKCGTIDFTMYASTVIKECKRFKILSINGRPI